MPNKNYVNGRAKEYRVVKMLRLLGYDLAQRTAGSHSEVDVIGINTKTKMIKLIQAKPNSMSSKEKEKIIIKNKDLNGEFKVSFEVI